MDLSKLTADSDLACGTAAYPDERQERTIRIDVKIMGRPGSNRPPFILKNWFASRNAGCASSNRRRARWSRSGSRCAGRRPAHDRCDARGRPDRRSCGSGDSPSPMRTPTPGTSIPMPCAMDGMGAKTAVAAIAAEMTRRFMRPLLCVVPCAHNGRTGLPVPRAPRQKRHVKRPARMTGHSYLYCSSNARPLPTLSSA